MFFCRDFHSSLYTDSLCALCSRSLSKTVPTANQVRNWILGPWDSQAQCIQRKRPATVACSSMSIYRPTIRWHIRGYDVGDDAPPSTQSVCRSRFGGMSCLLSALASSMLNVPLGAAIWTIPIHPTIRHEHFEYLRVLRGPNYGHPR
jgi:hypothetical protein